MEHFHGSCHGLRLKKMLAELSLSEPDHVLGLVQDAHDARVIHACHKHAQRVCAKIYETDNPPSYLSGDNCIIHSLCCRLP